MALIHEKMVAISKQIGAISKDEKNQQQRFNFRGIDTVYNELHNILAENEVFSLPEVIHQTHEERKTKSGGNLIYRILTIEYTFYASDGSSVTATVIGEGMDSGDKASNKAMSIGHKYALIQAFAIPTQEKKDPDSESHQSSQPVQDPALKAKKITELRSLCEGKELEPGQKLFMANIENHSIPEIQNAINIMKGVK
jgi:hypothetical protein